LTSTANEDHWTGIVTHIVATFVAVTIR